MGREHKLPSEKMGEATPPEDESKPFLLRITLFNYFDFLISNR